MAIDREELKTTADDNGWVLAFSCPTLDQFTLTPMGEARAKREVAVYFTAEGVMTAGYESVWDERGRFLGRPIPAEDVAAAMISAAPETARRY